MQASGCTEVDDKRGNVEVIFPECLQKICSPWQLFLWCGIRKCTMKCAVEYHLFSCRPKSWPRIWHIKDSSHERVKVRGTIPTENVISLEHIGLMCVCVFSFKIIECFSVRNIDLSVTLSQPKLL